MDLVQGIARTGLRDVSNLALGRPWYTLLFVLNTWTGRAAAGYTWNQVYQTIAFLKLSHGFWWSISLTDSERIPQFLLPAQVSHEPALRIKWGTSVCHVALDGTLPVFEIWTNSARLASMDGESRLLVTDEPGWVWERTSSSSRLQENFPTFYRNLQNMPRINKDRNMEPVGLGRG